MNDQEKLGRKLRQARDYVGYTQQEVADALGLLRPAVTEMEKGGRRVGATELATMARLYRKPVAYFLEDKTMEPNEQTVKLLEGLTEQDRRELLRFAEFLYWKRQRQEK